MVARPGSGVGQVLWVDAFFAGQEGEEEMYALLFEYGLQFGQATHTAAEYLGALAKGDAVGVEFVETASVVFVYKRRLKEVVVLAHEHRAGIGWAVPDCPEALVVEADEVFVEAEVLFYIAVCIFLPLAFYKRGEGELRFLGMDIHPFQGLHLDKWLDFLHDGEQEEHHGGKAEYLGNVAHGFRNGSR